MKKEGRFQSLFIWSVGERAFSRQLFYFNNIVSVYKEERERWRWAEQS